MFVISNNCCGGWLYKLTNTQLNNPFMWMLTSYDSILYTINNFASINWGNFKLDESELKPNTYKIIVEQQVSLHYIHYLFNPSRKVICDKKSYMSNLPIDDNEVEYCKIWEYVVNKYVNRTKRMRSLQEPPVFLLMDDASSHNDKMYDIITNQTNYHRIILTTQQYNVRDINTHIITLTQIDNPMVVMTKHYQDIMHILSNL